MVTALRRGLNTATNVHRNREAFKSLVDEWEGILVSDGYGLYRK